MVLTGLFVMRTLIGTGFCSSLKNNHPVRRSRTFSFIQSVLSLASFFKGGLFKSVSKPNIAFPKGVGKHINMTTPPSFTWLSSSQRGKTAAPQENRSIFPRPRCHVHRVTISSASRMVANNLMNFQVDGCSKKWRSQIC